MQNRGREPEPTPAAKRLTRRSCLLTGLQMKVGAARVPEFFRVNIRQTPQSHFPQLSSDRGNTMLSGLHLTNHPVIREIGYWLEPLSRKLDYTLSFLIAAAGYRPLPSDSPGQATVYYGKGGLPRQIIIPQLPADGLNPPERIEVPKTGARFDHDLVAASAALLCDEVNAEADKLDKYERIRFEDSWHATGGRTRALPIVNQYVQVLRACLENAVGKGMPLWPEGKTSAIGLSHDVDRLDQWGTVRGLWKGNPMAGARALAKIVIDRDHDGELLLDLGRREQSLGLKSTYLFASFNQFETKRIFDVFYSVNGKFLTRLIRGLIDQGHEIGLHASFDAFRSAEQFRREKERLEEVAGCPVQGLRHHFWHLGRNVSRTLQLHESAGFTYDTSLAFNETPGFRRSTALPFYPWDSGQDRAIRVLQLPVCAMDGNYFYRDGMTAAKCMDEMIPMLDEIDALGGVGVIDWHSDTSHPGTKRYAEWGRAYFELLDYLKKHTSRWVTSLGCIAAWVNEREERMGWSPLTQMQTAQR